MVDKNKLKKAYSLIEASIILVLLAIFISASSNIFASKVKKKSIAEIHGRFECYYKNDKLMEHVVVEGNDLGEKSVETDHCEFSPNQYARYVVINIVGGGAGVYNNGSASRGGGAGVYKSTFYPLPLYKYFLYPANKSNKDGNTSIVKGQSAINSEIKDVISAKGGFSGKDLKNSTIDDVKSCIVSETAPWEEYQCGTSAKCEIKDGNIYVSYCRDADNYKTETDLKYNDDNAPKYKSIVHSPQGSNGILENIGNTWRFYSMSYYTDMGCDPLVSQSGICANYKTFFSMNNFKTMRSNLAPCLYILELEIDLAQPGKEGETSQLTKYVTSMGFKKGITEIGPGNGGSVEGDTYGHPGGIVILY